MKESKARTIVFLTPVFGGIIVLCFLLWCAPLFGQAVPGDPLLKGQSDVDGAEIIDDAVDTDELDDAGDTPLVSEFVATDSATATQLEYLAAGAGISINAADVTCTSAAAATLGCVELDNALAGTAAAPEFAAGVAGDGIVLNTGTTPDSLDIDLNATVDGVGSTGNLSGMEITATNEVALIQGCADTEVLKWVNGTSQWDCAADAGASAIDLATQEELTVATGVVTSICPADNICAVDITVETGATDDVDTFNCNLGALLYLRANDTAETIVLKAHSGPDFSLDSTEDYAVYLCDTANLPELISRANGG